MEAQKTQTPKAFLRKNSKGERSHFLILNYISKLLQSKQYGTDIKRHRNQ